MSREDDVAVGERSYRIEVLAGGDPLRKERMTRDLRDALAELEGVQVEFAKADAIVPGSKSGALNDLALVVSSGAAAVMSRSFAEVLKTAIAEWCRKERRRKVRITRGDSEVEITGKPDARQEEIIREFVQNTGGDA